MVCHSVQDALNYSYCIVLVTIQVYLSYHDMDVMEHAAFLEDSNIMGARYFQGHAM